MVKSLIITLMICMVLGCAHSELPTAEVDNREWLTDDSSEFWETFFHKDTYGLLPERVEIENTLDTLEQVAWISMDADSAGGAWYRMMTLTTLYGEKLPKDYEVQEQ